MERYFGSGGELFAVIPSGVREGGDKITSAGSARAYGEFVGGHGSLKKDE